MLGPRSRVAPLCRAGLAVGILLGCVPQSDAETLQDIEGLSVKIDYRVHFTVGQSVSHTADASIHFYISSKGNVFIYAGNASIDTNTKDEIQVGGGHKVVAMDQASEQQYGQLDAWTMMNGHLTGIIKFIHGYAVTTIAIDPSRLTCAFDRQYQPDPQTGTIISNTSGRPVQIEAYKVTSYSCEVKKGNIFAANSE